MIHRKPGAFETEKIVARHKKLFTNCSQQWYSGFQLKNTVDKTVDDLRHEVNIHQQLYHHVPLPFQLLFDQEMLAPDTLEEARNKWINVVENFVEENPSIEQDFLSDVDDMRSVSLRLQIKLDRSKKKTKFNAREETDKINKAHVTLYRRYALAYSFLPYLDVVLQKRDEEECERMRVILQELQKSDLRQSDINLIEKNLLRDPTPENVGDAIISLSSGDFRGGEDVSLLQQNYTWIKVLDHYIAPIFIVELKDFVELVLGVVQTNHWDRVTIQPLDYKRELESTHHWNFDGNNAIFTQLN